MATQKITSEMFLATEIPMAVKPTGVAGRYGVALYELAVADKQAPQIIAELQTFKTALTEELLTFLASPAFAVVTKRLVIDEILKKQKASKLLSNFVKLVVEKSRGGFLAKMVAVVESLDAVANGVVNASVVSATKLTAAQTKEIEKFVKSTVPSAKKIEMTAEVDEKLIAGMKIRIGAVDYDATMANRLLQLGRSLRAQTELENYKTLNHKSR